MDDWTTESIIAAIRSKGITLRGLARQNGLSDHVISAALQKPHETGERVIAEFLGEALQTLWPSRYELDGTRKQPQPVENYRPAPRFANS